MSYEPIPGVLTEEDKMRLVLADTGHNVALPENLKNAFDATPPAPESDHEGADETEATPKVEEPSDSDKAAEAARAETMEHMSEQPETSGALSPNAKEDNKPAEEAPSEPEPEKMEDHDEPEGETSDEVFGIKNKVL